MVRDITNEVVASGMDVPGGAFPNGNTSKGETTPRHEFHPLEERE